MKTYLLKADDHDLARWQRCADLAGQSFAEWLREAAEVRASGGQSRALMPQASDHPGRMTAHGAAAAFNKDVSDVRRDPSYRALDDTVLPLTFEQEQRRLATPMRKSQLELEAEEMDRKKPRPDPFKKGLKNDD